MPVKTKESYKSSELIIQHSLKVKNTPMQHRRNHSVLGTSHVSFLAKFKTRNNKLDQERHFPQYYKDIM